MLLFEPIKGFVKLASQQVYFDFFLREVIVDYDLIVADNLFHNQQSCNCRNPTDSSFVDTNTGNN